MNPVKNNNIAVVKKISHRSLKNNRTRNIFAVCAILLTTFMLSSVFSIGISLIKNFSVMSIREAGTTASILLKKPSANQYAQIKAQSKVESVGGQIAIGPVVGKTGEGKNLQISLLSYDKSQWENNITPAVSHINGNYPVKEDEIMLSQRALSQLGITNPEAGQNIQLAYRGKERTEKKDFQLSGWYQDYGISAQAGIGLLSNAFCDSQGYSLEQDGALGITSKSRQQNQCLDQLQKEIRLKTGQKFDSSFNPDQNSSDLLMAFASILMIALFIVLSGYLLIHNIVYISVTKDIRFYGMLKTIGTSPKQIRYLVRSQTFRLAALGIPSGLILGALCSFAIVPYAINFFDAGGGHASMPGTVSFNPLIFIITALFSLGTIVLSCRKPAKIAGNVSPIEALKYTGIGGGKARPRNSTSGGKLHKMALHNIFREKKRTLLVLASLFMGTITYLCVVGFMGSLSVDNYIKEYFPDDFVITSNPPLEEKFDKEYLSDLRQIPGITSMETISGASCNLGFDEKAFAPIVKAQYSQYASDNEGNYQDLSKLMSDLSKKGELNLWVTAIDDSYVKQYNKTHEDQIDLKAFQRGEIAIIGYDNGNAYKKMIGSEISLKASDSPNAKRIMVGGVFDNEYYDLSRQAHTVGIMESIFVSKNFIKELSPSPIVNEIIINAEKDAEPYVKAQITALNKTLANQSFDFSARSSQAVNFQSSMSSLNILGHCISILLLVIGVLNFINVMLTSVYSRRNELAVMESIGMTKKQVKRMLVFEGGLYAIFTTCIIITVGNGILFFLSRAVTGIADYAEFHYPLANVLALVAILLLICLIVPGITFRSIAKDSVTERLRAAE